MKLDYRDILIEELERIQEKKASFSSRAYAKYLGLSPSHLSDVLKKRSGLSKAKAIEISEKLKFPDFRKELFVTSVEAVHSRSKKQREKLSKKVKELQLQRYRFLKEEVLSLLSEWHHFAILEMTKLDDFQLDAKWVSG
ncbi:MAG: hypothetical protein M9962_15385, partial [Oligoflexia bacterium]|nr:hypothetical protein [Oligoflexia bacterium]